MRCDDHDGVDCAIRNRLNKVLVGVNKATCNKPPQGCPPNKHLPIDLKEN